MLKTVIRKLDESESEGKWDFEISVRDTDTSRTFATRVSGGYQICEAAEKRLKELF